MSTAELTLAELGQRIRDAIERSGMEQKSVAEAAGIDPTALSKILAGKRGLSTLECARICDVLNWSPLALLGAGRPPVNPALASSVDRLRHLVELDLLLSDLGLPARSDRWPFTLLDRAIEAYVRGDVSIRPIAGILGTETDWLLDQLPRTELPRRPETTRPSPLLRPSPGGAS